MYVCMYVFTIISWCNYVYVCVCVYRQDRAKVFGYSKYCRFLLIENLFVDVEYHVFYRWNINFKLL